MVRLHPGAEAIISWEPDGSPQVMKVMTPSPEPLWEPLSEIIVNQNTPMTGTVYLCIPLSPAPSSLST
jgi:hypothetical protein